MARGHRETRGFIAAEALPLFTSKGFSETTIEEIAARAGISPRTLYRYFRSKDEILLHEGERHFDLLRERVRVARRRDVTFKVVESVARAHAEYLEEEWFAGRLLPLWLTTHDIQRRRLEAMHVDYPRLLSRDFARRDGLVTPAPMHRLAAKILMGLLVDATTPVVLDRSVPYTAQLDLVLNDWKRELQEWLGAG